MMLSASFREIQPKRRILCDAAVADKLRKDTSTRTRTLRFEWSDWFRRRRSFAFRATADAGSMRLKVS